MICEADTVGVFQIESRAQMQMLPRTRPRSIEDLTVQVAIIRPGPIVGGAVNPYVRHRQAQLADPNFKPPFDHPSLEPVLTETLGVILYQEQVLQAAVAVAGFTEGQAEALRRAMSRKRSRDNMERFYELFREGASARGVSDDVAKTVFEKIVAFAEFGFPKSHSAAFALPRLPVGMAATLLPRRVPLRPAQCAADGLLPAARAGARRKAPRRDRAAARHQRQRGELQRRTRCAARRLRLRAGHRRRTGAGDRRRARAQRRLRLARRLRAADGGRPTDVC